MKAFAHGLCMWLGFGLIILEEGLREKKPRVRKPKIAKPSWYDEIHDKEDRAN